LGNEADELCLETLDDVSWADSDGNALAALQLKHHSGDRLALTDKSVDVWRSIKVWLDGSTLREPDGPKLVLVTTQSVSPDGGLALLGPDHRDEKRALALLDQAARESDNQATAQARREWLDESQTVREGVVRRAVVLCDQATVEQLAVEIQQKLTFSLPVGLESQFVGALLGWWWSVAVQLLQGTRRAIRRIDLRMKMDDLREQASSRSLPVEWGDPIVSSADGYGERLFVKQIELIGGTDRLFLIAVRDYLRAYAHLQYWVENNFAELSELRLYEERLVREWEIQHELLKMRLTPNATEEELIAEGLRVFEIAMNAAPNALRSGFTDPFYPRGTHHRLADGLQVGWHPEFRARLASLLVGRVA
jgi:hypothetical protein